jgi:hypothetical protein
MKNLFLLPTDKPSRLYLFEERLILGDLVTVVFKNSGAVNQNIYITNSEEIKKGDWCYLNKDGKEYVYKCTEPPQNPKNWGLKIILTTDQDLIKDGVQAIDDDFIEWFVKNPSCEEVNIKSQHIDEFGNYIDDYFHSKTDLYSYKIIIPKEEPKEEIKEEHCDNCNNAICCCTINTQLSLEEALSNFIKDIKYPTLLECAEFGVKWQKSQDNKLYSEEEVQNILIEYVKTNPTKPYRVVSWFEEFKKK